MMARTIKATINKGNMKEKQKLTGSLLSKLRHIAQEPQHALPDVFVWMISNNKRIAYQRVQAKDIVFSIVDEERGKSCGKVQTLFLRVSVLSAMFTNMTYLWLKWQAVVTDYLTGKQIPLFTLH